MTVDTDYKRENLEIDPRVSKLLSFGKTIRPRDLFPVLVEEAATLIEQDLFAFALAAVLDRGTRSEIIWTIPYHLKQELGHLEPASFSSMSLKNLYRTFLSLPTKPRYINDAPQTVKELAELVVRDYEGDVTRIWAGQSSTYVKQVFRQVHGVGPGISSMIVLLLERCFGVRFTDIDHRTMDVKPDVHVQRVFKRLGFIPDQNEQVALKAARRLNPEYPGALDPPTWVIGKRWCFPHAPDCGNCPMNDVCPKMI